eukprot:279087_1
MSDTVLNGDINRFDFDGADMKQCVIDLLDAEDAKEPEVLKPTQFHGFSVLQRLFFELKQFWMVSSIWDYRTDDIECCTMFQRQYLLETHVFADMIEQCKSYEYKKHIIEYMAAQDTISIDSTLCEHIVRYINKTTDCRSFIQTVSESIDKYNSNTTAHVNKISEKQKDAILHYFESNGWDRYRVQCNSEDRSNVLNVLRQEAGLKDVQSIELYKYINGSAFALDSKDLDDFYHAMIRYKPIKKCSVSQLIYVLKTHLLPQLVSPNGSSRSNAHKYHESIVEYIEKQELNGE